MFFLALAVQDHSPPLGLRSSPGELSVPSQNLRISVIQCCNFI
ncbi:hypothetical protein DsansV1_C36g0232331 [Dioscorea sansibarensis]